MKSAATDPRRRTHASLVRPVTYSPPPLVRSWAALRHSGGCLRNLWLVLRGDTVLNRAVSAAPRLRGRLESASKPVRLGWIVTRQF
jgi:hypothetical protein